MEHTSFWISGKVSLSGDCPAADRAAGSVALLEVVVFLDSVNECYSSAHTPPIVCFKFPLWRNLPSKYILCPLTERGSMCFSGCQDCLAVQCKQIAAFLLFSQHLTSPVNQLKVLACTICSRAASQVCCAANAGVKLVERKTVGWRLTAFPTGKGNWCWC